MDGAFIENQYIETFSVTDKQFEHSYRVDVTDPAGGFLPGALQIAIDDSSLELQVKLDEEYKQLVKDRRLLRQFVFATSHPANAHCLAVNVNRIAQTPYKYSASTTESPVIWI